jgi:DNA-binding NtrC family response regulator
MPEQTPQYRALIQDDDESLRDLVSRSFTNAGFSVETARCAEEGLDKIKQAKTPFDLYFTDNTMGCGMTGLAFLEKVQDHKVFKVVYTSDESGVLFGAAIDFGANMTFKKPVSDLIGMVQEVYQGLKEYKSRA